MTLVISGTTLANPMSQSEEGAERIAAKPSTPEYERGFRQQSLAAAETALRLAPVRIACGLFAISLIALIPAFWLNSGIVSSIIYTLWAATFGVELLRIAFTGKSRFLRFTLAGHDFDSSLSSRRKTHG